MRLWTFYLLHHENLRQRDHFAHFNSYNSKSSKTAPVIISVLLMAQLTISGLARRPVIIAGREQSLPNACKTQIFEHGAIRRSNMSALYSSCTWTLRVPGDENSSMQTLTSLTLINFDILGRDFRARLRTFTSLAFLTCINFRGRLFN